MESLLRKVVELGHDAASLVELRRAAIAEVVAAVGAETALWSSWGPLGGGPDTACLGLDAAIPRRIAAEWQRYVPEMRVLDRTEVTGPVVVDRDVLGTRLDDITFSREIKQPIGAWSTLYCYLSGVPDAPSLVVLNRARHDRRFAHDHAVEALAALRPALSLAEAAVVLRTRPAANTNAAATTAWDELDALDRDMVELVRLGFGNAQIAVALARSPHTIRNRLSRLYERFGVATRAELVAAFGAPPADRYVRTGAPSPRER